MSAGGDETMRTFLVCNNVDCDERGSNDVIDALLDRVEDDDIAGVDVREYLCFSACELGPNVVCVEDRVWYGGVTADDVDEIVDDHMVKGQSVDRLRPQGEALIESIIFASLEAGVLPGQM